MHSHRTLANVGRALILTLACGLLFFSMEESNPAALAGATARMLGTSTVGLSAAVLPNPANQLMEQLSEKERELAVREERLRNSETRESAAIDPIAPYSFAISITLFALLILNFYFDWMRARRAGKNGVSALQRAIYLR